MEGNASSNGIVTGSTSFSATAAPSPVANGSHGAQSPQQQTNSGGLNCQLLGQSRINCSSEVYTDPATWRLSRNYLEHQIRILRVQLDELKVIRKHLRAMRPLGAPLSRHHHQAQRNDETVIGRPKSPKSKQKGSKLFDWSSPAASGRQSSAANPSITTVQSTVQKVHSPRRKPHLPVDVAKESSEDSAGHDDEDDDSDDEDEDDDSGPVETIEVTIYDNRKIKYVGPFQLLLFFCLVFSSNAFFPAAPRGQSR